MSAALGVTREYDHSVAFTADDRPAKASHPATPQGCAPEASGPVRDPARTAHRRTGLRIGRVPLTCLVPLPLKLGLSPSRATPPGARLDDIAGR